VAREQDVRLGRLAVERGLITEIQLEECLRDLTARLETSENPTSDSLTLVTVMLDKQFVQPAEITELIRMRGPQTPPPTPDLLSDIPTEVLRAGLFADSKCGKYTIVRLIGSGGMGAVYRAWDTQLKRFVALKFLTLGTDENIRRFIREAQTAARLNHTNITQIYDFGAADGRHYIAMEYIEGVTLDTLPETIRRTDLPKIVRLMHDVSLAVEYAHSKGVIHRDLKPQNVMIDDDLVPHVMDFGLARAIAVPGLVARATAAGRQITVSGTIVGTPNYVPPEQARGDIDRVDARSDVYSLGATLYALVTGRPPFEEASPMETLMAVLQQEPPAPRQYNVAVSRDLETVILKALSKDFQDRYASAREFADDLQRIITNEPILARRASSIAQLRAFMRRQPTLSLAVASLAVIVSFASALFYQLRQRTIADDRRVQDQIRDTEMRRQAEERRQHAAPKVDAARRQLDQAQQLLLQPDFRPAELEGCANGAMAALNDAILIDPTYAEAYALRAKANEHLRLDAAALTDLTRAIELSPAGAYFFERGRLQLLSSLAATRAGILLVPGLTTSAIRETPAARPQRLAASADFLKARPETPEDRFRVDGYRLLAEAKLSDAVAALGALHRRDAEGRYLLARVLFARGQFADAETNLQEALRARPNYAEAHILRAAALLRLDKLQEASAAIDQAAVIAPGLSACHILRGNLLLAKRQRERAIDEYDAALLIDANDAVALINRAQATDGQDALRSLNTAIQTQSEGREVALTLRSLMARDSAQGESDAEAATRENPEYAPAWRALAELRQRRGNLDGAAAARARAEELEKP